MKKFTNNKYLDAVQTSGKHVTVGSEAVSKTFYANREMTSLDTLHLAMRFSSSAYIPSPCVWSFCYLHFRGIGLVLDHIKQVNTSILCCKLHVHATLLSGCASFSVVTLHLQCINSNVLSISIHHLKLYLLPLRSISLRVLWKKTFSSIYTPTVSLLFRE